MAAFAALVAACGPWQRVGSDQRPPPAVAVAQLSDAQAIYDRMGLFSAGGALPFVGAMRFLASPSPESTLVQFSLSLANRALTFRRDGNQFVAEYYVGLTLRPEAGMPLEVRSEQAVRVRTFQETLRADESIVFTRYVTAIPGAYAATVEVRDRNGPGYGRRDRPDTVPAFARPALSSIIPIYEGNGRGSLAQPPQVLPNPRATIPYGGDTLRAYVEAYGVPAGSRLAARVLDENGTLAWSDTLALVDTAGFARAVLRLAAQQLQVGRQTLEVEVVGTDVRTAQPLLVSFSNQWVTTNYQEMVELLRYFDRQDLVGKLRSAAPDQRAQAWRDFWEGTDPVPLTPENEALDDYLQRVQIANARFAEPSTPGWLTDRGEVFISLGEPEEVFEMGNNAVSGQLATIRWTYNMLRLVVLFEDRTGFGTFKLTPDSRNAFLQVLGRVRRMQ